MSDKNRQCYNWAEGTLKLCLDGESLVEIPHGGTFPVAYARDGFLSRNQRSQFLVSKDPSYTEVVTLITCADVAHGGGRWKYDDVGKIGSRLIWRHNGQAGSSAQLWVYVYDNEAKGDLPGIILTIPESLPFLSTETWPTSAWLPGIPRTRFNALSILPTVKKKVSVTTQFGSTIGYARVTVLIDSNVTQEGLLNTSLLWGGSVLGHYPLPTTMDEVSGEPSSSYSQPLVENASCTSFFVAPILTAGATHSTAMLEDGTVWTWGDNSIGQLGLPISVEKKTAPSAGALALQRSKMISSNANHMLVLDLDGNITSYGDNSYGQCGQETGAIIFEPAPITSGGSEFKDFIAVSAGLHHSVALKEDGTVWTWGSNPWGQLGYDASGNSVGHDYGVHNAFPTPMPLEFDYLNEPFDDVVQISAGTGQTLALKSNGTVWGWGANGNGDLGFNGGVHVKPTYLSALSNIVQVAAGSTCSLALKEDGTVWQTGKGIAQGVAIEGEPSVHSPDDTAITHAWNQVTFVNGDPLTGIIQISITSSHVLAVSKNGVIYSWGANESGQLGVRWLDNLGDPVRVGKQLYEIARESSGTTFIDLNRYPQLVVSDLNGTPFTSVGEVAAGTTHSLCRRVDGSVWAWGDGGLVTHSNEGELDDKITYVLDGKTGLGSKAPWVESQSGRALQVYPFRLQNYFVLQDHYPNVFSVFETGSFSHPTSTSTQVSFWMKRRSGGVFFPGETTAYLSKKWAHVTNSLSARHRVDEILRGLKPR